MQKSLVFISHVVPEKEVALALKDVIEQAFLGMIDVFVSSDPKSLPAGRKWFQEISDALKTCSIEIVIASPNSVQKPWINFEAGAGFIRDIPVIPVCHSGMVPSKLPEPLRSLQALTATNETEICNLVPILAEAIGCTEPPVDFAEFIEKVKEYESTSKAIAKMSAAVPLQSIDGLRPYELATLVTIAEHVNDPDTSIAATFIRNELARSGHNNMAVTLALSALRRRNFIELTQEQDGNFGNFATYTTIRITEDGFGFLEGIQDHLVLTCDPPPANKSAPDQFYDEPDRVPF